MNKIKITKQIVSIYFMNLLLIYDRTVDNHKSYDNNYKNYEHRHNNY